MYLGPFLTVETIVDLQVFACVDSPRGMPEQNCVVQNDENKRGLKLVKTELFTNMASL